MEKLNISNKQLKSAMLDKVTENVELSTSFDNDAKKAGETKKVELTIDLGGVAVSDLISDALSSLRIKINALLKKNAVDSETYLAYLEKNDYKFSFSYAEIGGSTKGGNALARATSAWKKMTPEEREVFSKLMDEQARQKPTG